MATEFDTKRSTLGRAPWRKRDARATTRAVRRSNRVHDGFTLVELCVAMGLFAVLVGTAMAAFPRTPYAVWTAQAELVAELRRTRNDALTKGDHFRMVLTGPTTWETHRLSLVGGAWVSGGAPIRQGTLPKGAAMTSGVGGQFEYTTRGLLVTPDAAATIVVEDEDNAHQRAVTVWPSGQVAPA
jgi:prepilin-type N-terminal cleavage/methylation domain-containing protein